MSTDFGGALFDSHMHIFDPAYPMTPNLGFMPAAFTIDDYLERVGTLPVTLAGGAVVAASTQGFDQAYLLAALGRLGPGWAGVAQLPPSVTTEELVALDAAGVRAVRFNLRRGGPAVLDDLDTLARRVHETVGWHAELYVDSRDLAEMAGLIRALPAVSIDHLGLSAAGFATVVDLAGAGVRVKASGFGRTDLDVGDALRRLWDANPAALMFGTDLPCPRAPRPFANSDLDAVAEALGPDAARRVCHDNAIAFYRPPGGRDSDIPTAVDQVVLDAVAAMEIRDWAGLKPLLHPYLHWTGPGGGTLRGRTRVLARLAVVPPPGPPARYELRDGQVYRWIQPPG